MNMLNNELSMAEMEKDQIIDVSNKEQDFLEKRNLHTKENDRNVFSDIKEQVRNYENI